MMAVVTRSLGEEDGPALLRIRSAAISSPEPPGRPLAPSEQRCGLLLGMAQLHGALAAPLFDIRRALAFLHALLRCHLRMVARAVPSLAEAARKLSSARTALAALDFLVSPSIVSDPYGAHLAWTFLSSLAKEGAPATVRSYVIRLLPQICGN